MISKSNPLCEKDVFSCRSESIKIQEIYDDVLKLIKIRRESK